MATIAPGIPAINTLWEIQTGSPATFRTIANMGDLTGIAFSLALVDVTSHSTGQPWDQFIGTIFSGGDVAFPLFFVPASGDDTNLADPLGHGPTSGIMQVFLARVQRVYQMKFPDSLVSPSIAGPMNAVLYKFNWKSMVKDVLRADCTTRITGQPTMTFGS